MNPGMKVRPGKRFLGGDRGDFQLNSERRGVLIRPIRKTKKGMTLQEAAPLHGKQEFVIWGKQEKTNEKSVRKKKGPQPHWEQLDADREAKRNRK